ncbi:MULTISPECIES: Abi-alpha family protein [Klebsiella pneumoniae complex]|jgi:hypothetical protein|uniref:Abi-alpha family protein n=1 Tax=Klebsiella pneumoniae complex TaxID=3390273 RepID=UPI000E2E1D3B|nr:MULTISPECIES: Abi-alpha family protein [Klebsiella]HBR1291219.1 DUF4393 domain-containing protein [Klebsiella quasipneumoniae subsp. similipneumoniae]ELO7458090.1 DUF4393 domain-containing protein [Klebsiella pneumoniae]MBS2844098.1 DUF4393 domain-containing protein [Klebsiella pneumoniae]MBW5650019.1 DUF4393 domain-containing protein [Klebsiella pneumoniae]MBX4605265.1 hypothetical protein [Klebsiella pneumoniae]
MLPKLPSETVGEIYKDLFQPALRQFGEAGESVAKTVCLLSLPFVYAGGRYDQLLARVKKSFEKVPQDDLTKPPINAVFQIAEKLISMPADDAISKMYIELLSSCINKKWVSSVHPAFVNLISQLSGDEARFIDFLAQRERTIYLRRDNSWVTPTQTEIDNVLIPWYGSILDGKPINESVFYPHILDVPEYFYTYLEHLHSLGIIEYVHGPEYLLNKEFINSIKGYGHWYISLSKFGRLFYNVCIKNSGAND